MTTKPPISGAECIAEKSRNIGTASGVYRMLDKNGDVIYIGKAKNLKNRIKNYTRLEGHPKRIARMIYATHDMEFITTDDENEALLLEASLIKKLRPPYNILLRDDKSFPYILIAHDHEAPQILKHRGAQKRKGNYFGPFSSGRAVNETMSALERAFLLRSCSDSVYANRQRPCLLYQIKRCSAPCTGEISLKEYGKLVEQAARFLSGKKRELQQKLGKEMQEASQAERFEQAARLRDRITALTQVQASQTIHIKSLQNADIMALAQREGKSCIQIFFYRHGQNLGSHAYFPRHAPHAGAEEILTASISQFYQTHSLPRHIILSHSLPEQKWLEHALNQIAKHKVSIITPRMGDKKSLILLAQKNAHHQLIRKQNQQTQQKTLLALLQKKLGLKKPIKRIEVYDNSHLQSTNAIGAMIVAGEQGFEKRAYRKFTIKNPEHCGNDTAMMEEVLTRRLQRAKKENTILPDIILLDGGKGQVGIAEKTLNTLGIKNISLLAIAKGENRNAGKERFYLPKGKSFQLEERDTLLYFLQRLRDEAHRFAISTHRAKRKKAMQSNPLDEIEGIGNKRKKALLHHFGSAKAVSQASIKDIERVEGIHKTMAETIYRYFHERE